MLKPPPPPPCYADLAESLLTVLDLKFVRPNSLQAVTSASLYKALIPEAPPPKIQLRLPNFPWPRIWGRLSLTSLPQSLKKVGLSLFSNILTTGEWCHRLSL